MALIIQSLVQWSFLIRESSSCLTVVQNRSFRWWLKFLERLIVFWCTWVSLCLHLDCFESYVSIFATFFFSLFLFVADVFAGCGIFELLTRHSLLIPVWKSLNHRAPESVDIGDCFCVDTLALVVIDRTEASILVNWCLIKRLQVQCDEDTLHC